jgi:hypothetical protein
VTEEITPFFPEALKREVQTALKDASIYDIGSYGWLNEYEADPEFIGHAMWQIDQPPIEQSALFGEGPVRRRPKNIEREILTSGEDFCGVMEASRLSIGLALIWKGPAQENPINESTFFWLHHTDAFLKLAIASERLRDLLIIACTAASPKLFTPKEKNKRYIAPFDEAPDLIAQRGIEEQRLVESFRVLPSFGKELFKYIDRRNAIVHDVATRMAKFIGESMSHLQQRFDREQENRSQSATPQKPHGLSRAKKRRKEIEIEIDRAADELRQWYTLLIQASNAVFQVEYWTRRYDASQTVT